eukprot:TRINITY_DN4101_c0_g1_i1.p3 TRINITY_DN4101_c0_g1~~TRINITY_DN4101_c0_g1_i1.p3  ORF type:complete len:108 (+),score=10.33 TRINITY_DN4101_c0_g1_i1:238-561(+)
MPRQHLMFIHVMGDVVHMNDAPYGRMRRHAILSVLRHAHRRLPINRSMMTAFVRAFEDTLYHFIPLCTGDAVQLWEDEFRHVFALLGWPKEPDKESVVEVSATPHHM